MEFRHRWSMILLGHSVALLEQGMALMAQVEAVLEQDMALM